MKKLLFLVIFICISIFSFSDDEIERSVQMPVFGEIMDSLTIRSNGDLDFGNVLPGIPVNDLKSSFSIKGERWARVIIKGNGEYKAGSDNYRFNLVNEYGDTMPFIYYYSVYRMINPSEKNIPVILGSNGMLRVGITAGIRPISNQKKGVYRGKLVLSVRYD